MGQEPGARGPQPPLPLPPGPLAGPGTSRCSCSLPPSALGAREGTSTGRVGPRQRAARSTADPRGAPGRLAGRGGSRKQRCAARAEEEHRKVCTGRSRLQPALTPAGNSHRLRVCHRWCPRTCPAAPPPGAAPPLEDRGLSPSAPERPTERVSAAELRCKVRVNSTICPWLGEE